MPVDGTSSDYSDESFYDAMSPSIVTSPIKPVTFLRKVFTDMKEKKNKGE